MMRLQTRNLLVHKFLKCIGCFVALLFSIQALGYEQQQNTGNTTSNFQNIAIDSSSEIMLDSDWEFYWNALIEPGNFDARIPVKKVSLDNWTTFQLSETETLPSFGYATYRILFSVPKERPHISLYIPAIYASSNTWINGKLVSKIGHVGTSKDATLHRRFSQIIPLSTSETEFEVVIQVANFYHNKGGINKPIILGNSKHLQRIQSKKVIADMIFIGSLSFIGIFFLLFFLFYWNKDKAVLYFALMCICLAYMALSDRYAPFAEVFESVSWIFLTKVEYIFLFFAGTTASLFFNSVFSGFVHKMYPKVIVAIFCLLSLLAIILPAPHFTKFVAPFLLSMVVNLLYVTFVIIKAITSKRRESLLLLTSMLLASIVFYVHIYVFLGTDGNSIVYVNFGYIIVFILLSMLLMTRFSDSFRELERAKEFALEQKKEISIKSKELSKVNTELKENLRQLKSYNVELDNFAHIVSHDLKAPLISMHTLVSFIEEDLETVIDEDAENHFRLLKERITKMNALINGLLEYSKVAKGNKTKESFSLIDLLHEVINVIDPKHVNTIHLPNEDIELFASKIELEHVFQNLISNAIKHNDKEKIVVHVTASKRANEYIFSVRDNGPGIEAKYHRKIFDMFSQLTISKEIESTGIGLSIVKKIVTENYGIISVNSEKNTGTTINFTWRI